MLCSSACAHPRPAVGLLFLLSLALAFLVAFSLNFLIGMISIYTMEMRRITWVYHAVLRFFSGQMVPLWIFPPLLGQMALAAALPGTGRHPPLYLHREAVIG